MKYKGLNFGYTDEWIIVYDENKIESNPCTSQQNWVKVCVNKGEGISGNGQRNYALTKITNPNTLWYYLDDDNISNIQIYINY